MTLTLLLSFLHSTALLRISLLLVLLLNTFLLVIIQLLTEKKQLLEVAGIVLIEYQGISDISI